MEEVVFVNEHNHILEASRSNVFGIVDGELWTAEADGSILEGVTRGAVLEAANSIGVSVRCQPFGADRPFDELYVCSTLKEVAPVSSLNGKPVGGGPVGEQIYQCFRDIVKRETLLQTS